MTSCIIEERRVAVYCLQCCKTVFPGDTNPVIQMKNKHSSHKTVFPGEMYEPSLDQLYLCSYVAIQYLLNKRSIFI